MRVFYLLFVPLQRVSERACIDREAQTMKLIPEEDEKRRLVFWELLNLDCRLVRLLFQLPVLG
jgi:hypothetical protein